MRPTTYLFYSIIAQVFSSKVVCQIAFSREWLSACSIRIIWLPRRLAARTT